LDPQARAIRAGLATWSRGQVPTRWASTLELSREFSVGKFLYGRERIKAPRLFHNGSYLSEIEYTFFDQRLTLEAVVSLTGHSSTNRRH
jgi:hypothetical protein